MQGNVGNPVLSAMRVRATVDQDVAGSSPVTHPCGSRRQLAFLGPQERFGVSPEEVNALVVLLAARVRQVVALATAEVAPAGRQVQLVHAPAAGAPA